MACTITVGGRHEDARGTLRFCNDFDLSPVRRFYTIANSAEQPQRGWIGHRRETKWFFPLRGATRIVAKAMDGASETAQSFLLDAACPTVLCVPPGHWFCIEQRNGAEVQVFSDRPVGAFADDDFRMEMKQ